MAAKTDFASALKKRTRETAEPAREAGATPTLATTPEQKDRPPSRRGKKHIGACVELAVFKQLGKIALDEDTTIQALICRGLNMVFLEKGMQAIADDVGKKGVR